MDQAAAPPRPSAGRRPALEAAGARRGAGGRGPVAGAELVRRSYAAALATGYLWHEFGDSHLVLP
jgi:hypothetical protein